MKKLLSLLSVVTITGTAMPIVVATAPHEKEEINLEKLIRSKRDNHEIVIDIEGHDDLLFQSNDINVQWYSSYGLNWILKIGVNSCNTILNWWKNDPNSPENKINKFAIILGILVSAAGTDYLSQLGYQWSTLTATTVGLTTGALWTKASEKQVLRKIIDLIVLSGIVATRNVGVWISFNSVYPVFNIGNLNSDNAETGLIVRP
ncbi:hypothetical protein [Spiroplasma endosymbiont of Asaphidion curtum]|uniref:hypothetical protein n=1 Tax=Spiroplasma endosymbiont of Asaphidion curtum TaxID=3066281 RepID=UPI00313CE8ED